MTSSAAWFLGPMLALDFETTGVDTREDRIVTGYAGLLLPTSAGGGSKTEAKVLINPEVPIPAEASIVHGIYDVHVQAHGCDPHDGINSMAEAVARALKARIPVVGSNLAFDLAMLHWECIRYDVSTVAERIGCSPGGIAPIIDAYVLDKHVEPYRPGKRNLEALCARWGVRIDGAHDCEYDAKAAARVAYRIAQQYREEVGDLPVNVLHDLQVGWRREQAASLQYYFRHKATPRRPAAVVDPCWPLCVDLTHPTAPQD